jgi:hypothetical protein
MTSKKLKKVNPIFESVFHDHENDTLPRLKAEYIDGSKWDIEVNNMQLRDIRSQFYNNAEAAGDAYEMGAGEDDPEDGFEDEVDDSVAKAAAAKAAATKAPVAKAPATAAKPASKAAPAKTPAAKSSTSDAPKGKKK